MATRDTYTKVHETWENKPSKATPVMGGDLEHIEDGVKAAMDNRALKEIYGDMYMSLGENTLNGGEAAAIGRGNSITNSGYVLVVGQNNRYENGGYSTVSGERNTVAGGFHGCFGNLNTLQGGCDIAAGERNDINGNQNAGFGQGNTIQGDRNFTAGQNNNVEGNSNSCLGISNTAKGNYNFLAGSGNKSVNGMGFAVGIGLIARSDQTVIGRNNEEDIYGKYAFIIGRGYSETNRYNIMTVDVNGNIKSSGDVTTGAGVSLNSLKSYVETVKSIAEGASTAKVFDTKADLDEWLAAEGNPETLKVGQNIYIKDTGTPDYWWDGTGLQILETDKGYITEIPTATVESAGKVKPDGTTIVIAADGTISAVSSLELAQSVLGGES